VKTTYQYIDQIKDQYGNLLLLWGVYEKSITLKDVGQKPTMVVKILQQFDSLKKAQKYLDENTDYSDE
jgi:hypothetical protein